MYVTVLFSCTYVHFLHKCAKYVVEQVFGLFWFMVYFGLKLPIREKKIDNVTWQVTRPNKISMWTHALLGIDVEGWLERKDDRFCFAFLFFSCRWKVTSCQIL